MRKLAVFILVLILALGALPTFAQDEPTIAEIVVASTEGDSPEFTILLAAVGAADPAFLTLLSDPEAGVTVFAPTDAAFAAAFEALGVTPEEVLANTDLLNAVLAYHVVPNVLPAEAVVALEDAYVGTFLADSPLYISIEDDVVYVDDAAVIATDVMASNGVVHVIDAVLLPDMEGMDEMDMDMEEPTMTLGEIAIAATEGAEPEFTTLVAAVTAADPIFLRALTGDFASGAQPLTVFAPTDAAFAAAFQALGVTPEAVLANTDLLNSVLAYHILPGSFSSDVVIELAAEGARVATANPGLAVTLSLDGDNVKVDAATVTAVDIAGTNGYIHVIDSVLLPSQ